MAAVTFMDPIPGLTKENSNEEDTPKRGFLLRLEALMKKISEIENLIQQR
jgi:hypothetical protein